MISLTSSKVPSKAFKPRDVELIAVVPGKNSIRARKKERCLTNHGVRQ